MNLNEYKLLLTSLSRIKPGDLLDPVYLKVSTFKKLLDIKRKMYIRTEDYCTSLQSKTLLIYLKKDNSKKKKSYKTFNWFQRIVYDDGLVQFKFSPELKPYLLNLTQYTKYNLKNIINLDSKYSIRIYELVKQYQLCKKRIFKLKEFKVLINADKPAYSKPNYLRKLLNKCVSEINIKTDLYIDFDEIKKGRSIEKIKFIIQDKSKLKNTDKLSKEKLILKLQNMIFNRTGKVIDATELINYHRIILIELLNDLINNNFDKVLIQNPKAFFIWHLNEKRKNYDCENILDF
jgi:plasmid replication initiation protein